MDGIIQQVKARRRELGVTLRDVAELSGIGLHLLRLFELRRGGMSLKHVVHVLGLCLTVQPKRKPE